MIAFLNTHKTKITGALLVLAGALQANSTTVQSLMPPRAYAYFTLCIGCLVAVLGFINQRQ